MKKKYEKIIQAIEEIMDSYDVPLGVCFFTEKDHYVIINDTLDNEELTTKKELLKYINSSMTEVLIN